MFAKGKQPGFSPKAEVLLKYPNAKAERTAGFGMTGWAVFSEGKRLGSGPTPLMAWLNSIKD